MTQRALSPCVLAACVLATQPDTKQNASKRHQPAMALNALNKEQPADMAATAQQQPALQPAAQPAAADPGPKEISNLTMLPATYRGICPRTQRRLFALKLDRQLLARHAGVRPTVTAEHADCEVTDGIEEEPWDARPSDVFAAGDQNVLLSLSHPIALPELGVPITVPDHVRAYSVHASKGEPILVLIEGRLVSWNHIKKTGAIRASGRDGSMMRISVRPSNLMIEGNLPAADDAVPVVDQLVHLTAVAAKGCKGRWPEAQRVWAKGGHPVRLVVVEEEMPQLSDSQK